MPEVTLCDVLTYHANEFNRANECIHERYPADCRACYSGHPLHENDTCRIEVSAADDSGSYMGPCNCYHRGERRCPQCGSAYDIVPKGAPAPNEGISPYMRRPLEQETEETFDGEYLICPYCGYKHGDAHEFFETTDCTSVKCYGCDRDFTAVQSVSVNYIGRPIDG